jgi:small subunit ribosomal protein S1
MPESDAFAQESNQDQLQEQYLKALDHIEEGGLIEGEVIQVDGEYVYLDVGLKSDGKVPVGEFKELPEVGDTVETVLVKREGRHGEVVISKKKADMKAFWKTLRDAFDADEPVTGTVAKSIKGGFEVDLGFDVRAFCPISKMDVQRIENPEEYIGLESPFMIDRLYSEKKVNIVLTRRQWLEKRTEENRAKFFETVTIGDEVEGTVKSFTSFGAFIDLGGFDGLLHINDMSWGHVTRPKDYVKKNEKIKLKVIRLDPEEKKINLSLKHFQQDPWSTFEDKYHVDQVIKGRVTKLTDFGAFIEIEEGIEGLAHISELSWVKRVKHPKELFNIGDECEAMILGYDIPQGRISLGLKQVLPNPWEEIESKYPVGTKGEWVVKKITNAGAFVELEEGIDAFLHADDLSWTKRIRNVGSVLTEGEKVEAVVTSVNPEERRIRLGVKQLEGDPWATFRDKHPRGSIIEGEITGKTDFGVFVKVEGDIEGLIHKNNLTETREEDAEEKLASLNVGDKIKASVTDVNTSKQKLSLSVREMKYREERAEISKYMDTDEESGDSYTLADMLKDKED